MLIPYAQPSTVLWTPAWMFSGGAPGAWFDPADFGTLYQDSLGTTPVTATGQPVGLILDKSQGLALSAELVTVNFTSSTGWTFGTVGTSSAASVSGGALSLPRTDGSNFAQAGFSIATTVGKTYQVRWTTGAGGTVQIRAGGSLGNAAAGAANLAANSSGTFVFNATANPQFISFVPQTDASTDTVTAASAKRLFGNHASQSTTTARPTLQQDASGFYYLSYDGVDDSLATQSVDFTTTQLATVFAGVRKLSDAAAGAIASLYNGGTLGTFGLLGPGGAASATYAVQMGATGVNTGRTPTIAAPNSSVLTGSYDLSQVTQANQLAMRVNAVAQSLTLSGVAATPQSGFVNQALGVGFAIGGTNFFNGRLYGLVAIGKTASAVEIASAERYIGNRMGIAL